MFDFKSHFAIVKSVAQETAKELAKAKYKPSLGNKQAMANYARAVGAIGVKASFTEEQQANMIEWSV